MSLHRLRRRDHADAQTPAAIEARINRELCAAHPNRWHLNATGKFYCLHDVRFTINENFRGLVYGTLPVVNPGSEPILPPIPSLPTIECQ